MYRKASFWSSSVGIGKADEVDVQSKDSKLRSMLNLNGLSISSSSKI